MYWRRQLPWIPPRIAIRTWSTSLIYWKRIDNVGILADGGCRHWCFFVVLIRLKIDIWFHMNLILIGGDWSLKYSKFEKKKTNSFESVAIPSSTRGSRGGSIHALRNLVCLSASSSSIESRTANSAPWAQWDKKIDVDRSILYLNLFDTHQEVKQHQLSHDVALIIAWPASLSPAPRRLNMPVQIQRNCRHWSRAWHRKLFHLRGGQFSPKFWNPPNEISGLTVPPAPPQCA